MRSRSSSSSLANRSRLKFLARRSQRRVGPLISGSRGLQPLSNRDESFKQRKMDLAKDRAHALGIETTRLVHWKILVLWLVLVSEQRW